MAHDEVPSRDASVTPTCPVCGRTFAPSRAQRYCSHACRSAAWRRRHQPAGTAAASVPGRRSTKAQTVYECEMCAVRSLGEQRCSDCGAFMRKLGLGGLCPHCDEPLTVAELLDGKE